MKRLTIDNPFNAPVYHAETVGSTMDVSRDLALNGEPHGTVITADFQETGRGRIRERPWNMERGSNLPFTILLRYPGVEHIPPALTLRAGLAVALAIEEFAPALAGQVMIKWPNDIVISADTGGALKLAGILTEADGSTARIGIGVNVAQQQFPDFLRDKAVSISLAARTEFAGDERFILLEKIIAHLYREVEPPRGNGADWKSRIEARLYQKGARVSFAEGAAGSGKIVTGILAGINQDGALLISHEAGPRAFTTGELMNAYAFASVKADANAMRPCHKQP